MHKIVSRFVFYPTLQSFNATRSYFSNCPLLALLLRALLLALPAHNLLRALHLPSHSSLTAPHTCKPPPIPSSPDAIPRRHRRSVHSGGHTSWLDLSRRLAKASFFPVHFRLTLPRVDSRILFTRSRPTVPKVLCWWEIRRTNCSSSRQ